MSLAASQARPAPSPAVAAPPRVSVGLPVYNGAATLAEAIDSILGQTCADLELVIADNASTDDTEAICRDAARRDPRVRYERHERNLGAAANYNLVFARSRGAYFKWAAHDDRLEPTFIERCAAVLDAAPPEVVLCFPETVFIDGTGRVIDRLEENPDLRLHEDLDLPMPDPHDRLRHFVRNMSMCHPVFGLIRADVLRRTRLIGPFHSSDVVLLAELALRGRFRALPEPLFVRRLHPGTSLWNRTPEEVAAWFDTSRRPRAVLRHTRLVVEQLRSVHRAGLPLLDRGRCYGVVIRHVLVPRRRVIAAEIVRAAGRLLRRPVR